MADMIKFFKGLEASLPASGVNGALYITTDEGAIYLGTGTGMKRLGDFVQVDNVASLPEKAHESCLYYCVAENILAKWNGSEWKQINKQPTAEELKVLLGLGSLAYLSEVAEANLNSDLAAKINAASGAQHTHANKELLDTYTQTEANLADAVAKKHAHANADELAKIADGDKAKWDAVVADHLTSADKTTLENAIKEAKKAGTDANTALETYKVANDARVLAVEEDIAEITNAENGILAQAKAYADGKDGAIAEAKKAGTDASTALEAYKTSNDEALADEVKAREDADTAINNKIGAVTEGKTVVEMIADAQVAATYDDEEVRGLISDNADAIAAEQERAEGIEAGLRSDVDIIKGDYLKSGDKTELANAIAAEKERAEGVEASLQTQINTIMNNPDAEGAINSINEFTQYVKDHGTIADGFRTDIDKNKEDIAANAKAIADQATADAAKYETKDDASAKLAEAKEYADGINTALDARLDVLEAIDHDAYVGADATLKAELQAEIDADVKVISDALATAKTEISAEIDADVKALADGQVATNTSDIANLLAQMQWGEF